MGSGDLCRVPQAAVRHGRARQSSGTGPCRDCIRVLWVPGPRGQYSGKIRFIENPGVKDELGKRTSDTRGAYPEVRSGFGENSVCRETRGTRRVGSPCG